jgi:hypothetical protein
VEPDIALIFHEICNQIDSSMFAAAVSHDVVDIVQIRMKDEIQQMNFSVNSLRLWLPEIFQVINDYEYDNNGTSSICKMLDNMQPTIINEGEICSVVNSHLIKRKQKYILVIT